MIIMIIMAAEHENLPNMIIIEKLGQRSSYDDNDDRDEADDNDNQINIYS